MNLNTKEFFSREIESLAIDIKKLIAYDPIAFNLDLSQVKGKKNKADKLHEKAIEIANKISNVEIFFTLVSELNKNLNENVNQKEGASPKGDVFITLCEKLEDLTALFYSSRAKYWYYLNYEGRVIEQRIRCLFYRWGYKYQLGLDMISYFEELNRLLKISYESKIPFAVLVDSVRIRENLNDVKVEDILKEKIFSKDGIYYLSNARFNKDTKKESLNVDEISADERQSYYLNRIFKNPEVTNEVVIKGKIAIEDYLKYPTKYSIVAKTSQSEYFVNNNENEKIIRDSFQNLENLESLAVDKREKTPIKLSLNELYEGAKELDSSLEEFKRFREKNLKEIDFIEVQSKKKTSELIFNGFDNFVGMVNTGKTNFMVSTAYTLAKKGFKTCLVLRDNQDVFEQLESLNKSGNVKAVALVGPTSKVSHTEKILNSNINKVEKTKFVDGKENILDILNDERLEYGTYTCPIKSLFDTKSDNTSDIYLSNDEKDKILCNKLYLRKTIRSKDSAEKHTDVRITCPFSKKCDSLKVNEYLPKGDIFLTNMASFIKTEMNSIYFPDCERVSKYIYDTCDLVLVDESDAMQFQFDSSFSDSMPIYNDIDNPSILEKIKEYKAMIDGNVHKFREHNKLLFRVTKTEMIASEILDKFTENKVPGYLKNGPLVSKKIFNTLSYLLSRNPELLKANIDSLNGLEVKYVAEDETKEEEISLIRLNEFFKGVNQIIYQSSSQGLSAKEYIFAEKYEDEYIKYKDWFSYLEAIGCYDSHKIHLLNIYSSIKSKNIIYPETQAFIESDPKAKNLVLELISLAVLLTSIEGDLNKITNTTGYVKSILYDISKKDVPNIPISKGYVRDYRGLISKCPLGLYFGLRYNKEKKCLDMISWEGIGRDLFYQYDELWKYKENDKDGGINISVFSGTSYMPTSPIYHILKDVNYLMKSNTDEIVSINYDYKPICDEHGKTVINSGSNKSNDEVANRVYRDIAKGLTKNIGNSNVLSEYLKKYTFEGRERLIVSVGNYRDALRLASFLYELNIDPNIQIATLYKDGIDDTLQFSLPIDRRINKDTMKRIENTNFNIVVAPQSAIQRGINMLKVQIDETDENESKMVASFGGILKTNRDYQVPNNHMYAVARVSHVLEKEKQKLMRENINSDYSLSKEVSSLFKLAENTYNDYYSTKFFAKLEKNERDMLMGDSTVEDIQFCGRSIRGNVNASIVLLDGAFFRNYTNGELDNEKTSTIVAMKQMCDEISNNSATDKFLMESLYGPFLKGMSDLIERVQNNKL